MIATRLHAQRHSSLTGARSSVASIPNFSHHHHQQRRKASIRPSRDVPNIDSDDHEDKDEDDDDDDDDDEHQQPHSKVEIFLSSFSFAKSSWLRSQSSTKNLSVVLEQTGQMSVLSSVVIFWLYTWGFSAKTSSG
jgi:hypothetical protein